MVCALSFGAIHRPDVEQGSGDIPFGVLSRPNVAVSNRSLASDHQHKPDYRNLPYRTLDIDCRTGTVLYDTTVAAERTTSVEQVRLDHWNYEQDDSFQSYVIRRAVRTNECETLYMSSL